MGKMHQVFRGAKGFAVGRWVLFIYYLAVLIAVGLMAACAPPAPEVVEKEVIVEKEVPVTIEVEKEVVVVEKLVVETVIVEKEVAVEEVEPAPTPTPIPTPEPFVCEESDNGLVCKAEREGVTVVVPWQGREVRVENLPLGTPEEQAKLLSCQEHQEHDEFCATRLVINFEVVEGKTGEMLSHFDPSIELHVEYTSEDFAEAQEAGGGLVLGFWDDTRWVAFTEEKHGFELWPDEPPETGVGVAWISSWGDRRIGWGH